MQRKYLPLIIVLLLACGAGYGLKLYFNLVIAQAIIATATLGALEIVLLDLLDGYLTKRSGLRQDLIRHPLEAMLYDPEISDDEFHKELMNYIEEVVMTASLSKRDEENVAWLRKKVRETRPGVWKKFNKDIPKEHKGCCDPDKK